MNNYHYAPQYFMEPLHPITVTVVGVGGNGTQVLNDLAKIHCSLQQLNHPGLMVYAIDNDKIEQTNIGRQKFSQADLGQYKAVVAITRLNRFYSLDWRAIPERYKTGKKTSNITISCVDNVKTRTLIEMMFTNSNNTDDYLNPYYWLDFGNCRDFGQFVLGSRPIDQPKPSNVDFLKNVLQMFPDMEKNEDIAEPSCSTREALAKQDLFINTVLVSTGMNLIWTLLTKYRITHHGGYVNLSTCVTKPIKI